MGVWIVRMVSRVHIYVDGTGGTGDQGGAACGFAVLAVYDDDSYGLVGYFGAPITADAEAHEYLAATKLSSGVAEMCGLTWVSLWVLQAGDVLRSDVEITVWYDCMYAANIAAAAATPRVNKGVASLNSGLYGLCSRKYDIRLAHVRAHAGHPWNE